MATTREAGRYGLMKLIDVMSQNPITVTASETIGQADEIMSEHRFRQLPVVDGNKLLGIITDRDIRSFLSGSLYSTTEAREKALQTKIADVMTTEPLTLAPDDELPAAVELLIDEKIGGIPIVDEVEGLVGIVTYVDVLRCFMHQLQEE